MRNIVVTTDFSVKSYNALSIAKAIAKKTKGTIHLIHVIEPIAPEYSSLGEVLEDDFDDIYTLKLVQKLNTELSILKKANSDNSFIIQTKILVGDTFKKIKEYVKESNADLMVIGAKGFTDAEEFFLGSLTDKIVRSISCPVITVKEVVDEYEFENIVYATNLKEDNDHIIKFLKGLQDLFNSKIHIVKVNTRKNFRNDIDTQVDLQLLVDKYQIKNYTLSSYSHEDEEYGIVYFSDSVGADLIVMGVHEKIGFRRLISGGSLADEVTEHTFRPVLTYNLNNDK